MANALSWVGPLSLGAAAMYLFDPIAGRRRRARVRDQAIHMTRRTGDAAGALAHDLQNRAAGLAAVMRRGASDGPVDDAVLDARVRSALGRVCSHPGAIGVASVQGIIELVGPVLAREYEAVWTAVNAVPGVIDVVDNMVVHERADNVPGLQGDGRLPAGDATWSPTTRMLAVLGGAGLIAYGVRHRTVMGGLAAAAGAGLVARGFSDRALDAVFDHLRLPVDDFEMDQLPELAEWPEAQPGTPGARGEVREGVFGSGAGPAVVS
jgi:hypothetical protein